MATYPIRNRHWTRKEYDELIKSGFFDEDEPIELLGGQLIVAEPKGSPHSTAVALTVEALRMAFGPGWLVRVQDPVALDAESEPEPDVAVVPGLPRDYLAEHPARPGSTASLGRIGPRSSAGASSTSRPSAGAPLSHRSRGPMSPWPWPICCPNLSESLAVRVVDADGVHRFREA
ncbi:MAG: hypothetical protein DME03_06935 [Candidatus Rokuibacteriota bacterium]|nr:MAG: hypothetical protein DME03_06935 [Candidatus Rokubacteria bacterium]